MYQPPRLSLGGNEVIPAPCHMARRRKSQHTVRQWIALMVIEKQPAVQFLLRQRFLNLRHVHRATSFTGSKNGFHFSAAGACEARLTTISATTEIASAG